MAVETLGASFVHQMTCPIEPEDAPFVNGRWTPSRDWTAMELRRAVGDKAFARPGESGAEAR